MKKGMTNVEFIICIVALCIILIVALPIATKYAKQKGEESAENEYKIKQYEESLIGMNYNHDGWYKDCKVKIFFCDTDTENKINNFISNKDIVDMKMSSCKYGFYIIIIYTNSLKNNHEDTIHVY